MTYALFEIARWDIKQVQTVIFEQLFMVNLPSGSTLNKAKLVVCVTYEGYSFFSASPWGSCKIYLNDIFLPPEEYLWMQNGRTIERDIILGLKINESNRFKFEGSGWVGGVRWRGVAMIEVDYSGPSPTMYGYPATEGTPTTTTESTASMVTTMINFMMMIMVIEMITSIIPEITKAGVKYVKEKVT